MFANGDVYEGSYRAGKRQGQGVYTFRRGGSYAGNYARNAKSGAGRMVNRDGSTYEGSWRVDKRHGEGVYNCAPHRQPYTL